MNYEFKVNSDGNTRVILMNKLGMVETSTRDGFLIVKPSTRDVLKLVNSSVYDENNRRIGRIVDVIGRVDDPRVVVKLESKGLAPSSTILYYYLASQRKHKRGGRR